MAPSSPLGLFGKLPREVRDEIYFHALGHVCIGCDGTLVDMERRKPLFLLAVAWQISLEASQSLSSRTTLHFDGETDWSSAEFIMKVANIRVTLDARISKYPKRADRIYREKGVGIRQSTPEICSYGGSELDYFTGAWRVREAAHVHFCPIDRDHAIFSRHKDQPPLICSEKLRYSIRHLAAFRKVVLVLEFVVNAGDASLETYGSNILRIIDVNNTEPFDDRERYRFKRLTRGVSKDFSKYLGALTVHFVDRANGDFVGIITYHPRKAPNAIPKDAAKAEDKSNKRRKQ